MAEQPAAPDRPKSAPQTVEDRRSELVDHLAILAVRLARKRRAASPAPGASHPPESGS